MVTLQIVVTENCNLGCSYCYMKNRNTILSRETFMDFYRSLPSDNTYQIDFFGGEPLLNWDMVEFITETISDDPRFLPSTMPSNGLLLTQDKVNYIKRNNIIYSWSCDGLWEENIDAAIRMNDKVYIFKNDEYIRYDIKTRKIDQGYPKKIKGNWIGLWEKDIDAAVNTGNGKLYFSKTIIIIRNRN